MLVKPTNRLYQSFNTCYRGPPSYATVIHCDQDNPITDTWLRQTIESYSAADDVFRYDFLKVVIFIGVKVGARVDISPAACQLLDELGNRWHRTFEMDVIDEAPPPGPYLAAGQSLLEIFRLYDDVQGAFINGLIPTSHSYA